jgi:hypothetical protein
VSPCLWSKNSSCRLHDQHCCSELLFVAVFLQLDVPPASELESCAAQLVVSLELQGKLLLLQQQKLLLRWERCPNTNMGVGDATCSCCDA